MNRIVAKHLSALILGTIFLAASCTGSIESSTVAGEAPPPDGPGGQVLGSDGKPPGPLPPTPLRRLTHTEYDFTIRDLLGIPGQGSQLDQDGASRALFNNTAEGLTVDTIRLDKYESVAERIVETAMQPSSKTRSDLL